MTTVQTIRTITDRAVAGLLSGVSQEVNDLASLDISTLTSEQLVEAEVKYLKTYSELANQHVANRRRHFNSLQLISRIPDEILLEVISLTPDRPASKRYFRDLHHLACVSFRWGTLIKNSPSLWAVVLTGFVAPIQALALKKSKSCALEVGSKAPEFTSGNFDFISRVAVHLYRWRSATLNVDRTDRITPLCSAAAPLLKDLSIRVNPQPSDRQYVIMDLFGGKAERLRHLTLERCWIPWDSQLLSGLESLQLINVKRDGPSLLQLMEVLRSCPNLTIFRIKQVHVGIVVSQDVAPVELKHLTSCTIVGVDSQMTQTLLARIVAPGCSSLVADWDGADADDFLGALTNWLPSVRSIIKSSSGVKLGITGSTVREGFSLYLRASVGALSPLDINLKKQTSSEPLVSLVAHVAESAAHIPTQINIHHSSPLAPPKIIPFCSNFPALSEVQIWCPTIVESFVEHLSHPMEADGTLHWPFPQVTSVDLRDSSLSVDPLLRMFRARYGPTQLPDGSGNVPRSAGDSPTPLTRLVLRNITGLDLAAMEEIKRLLPDCALEVSPLLPALLQLS